jgi:hypothetical protein
MFDNKNRLLTKKKRQLAFKKEEQTLCVFAKSERKLEYRGVSRDKSVEIWIRGHVRENYEIFAKVGDGVV